MYLLECEGMQFGLEANRLLRQVELPLNNASFRIVQNQPAEPHTAHPSPVTSALASVIAVFDRVLPTIKPDGGYVSATDAVDAYSGTLHTILFCATTDQQVQSWLDSAYMFGKIALYSETFLGYYNAFYLLLMWAYEHDALDAVLHRAMQHQQGSSDDATARDIFCIIFILLTFSASIEQVDYFPNTPWSWQEPLALQEWLDMMDRADIAERVREVSQQVQYGVRDEAW